MFLQGKIDRALKKLHGESEEHKIKKHSVREEPLELEKNDFLAMLIAAFLTIIPVAVVVLAAICVLGYFFLMH